MGDFQEEAEAHIVGEMVCIHMMNETIGTRTVDDAEIIEEGAERICFTPISVFMENNCYY